MAQHLSGNVCPNNLHPSLCKFYSDKTRTCCNVQDPLSLPGLGEGDDPRQKPLVRVGPALRIPLGHSTKLVPGSSQPSTTFSNRYFGTCRVLVFVQVLRTRGTACNLHVTSREGPGGRTLREPPWRTSQKPEMSWEPHAVIVD